MAQNDLLKRYVDAAVSFTAMTQSRAEAVVRDLVKAGEVQADQARETVTDLLERSRENSERLLETIRNEVRQQITNLGLASKDDLDRIEQRIASLIPGGAGGRSTATRKAPAKKATSAAKTTAKKKATAKKATTKKAAATRAPAKKSTKKA